MTERDDLIQQLAANEAPSDTGHGDPTLAQFKAELQTIESQIRQSESADSFAAESECQQAVERVAGLGREMTATSAGKTEMYAIAPASAPLGTLGQYRLISKLGEGGMGAVYKAVHSHLEKIVAIKVLPLSRLQDAQAVGRFQREMRAVGKLQHPNIVAAHDAGEIDGTHYLVMELVDGIDLGQLVSRIGPLPINSACELIRQAALGLQHAYEHNMVHRDIKPSNLMLAAPASSKGAATVKVLDLGLALLEGGQIDANELTSTGQVMGTIDYMAPEQGTDTHGVDIRADIYSLGASLYKLLTGRAPFADPQYSSPIKKLMALATQTPKPVENLRSDCPPELVRLVARLLSKNPDDRPAPPDELVVLLEPFTQGADLRALLAASRDPNSAAKLHVGPVSQTNPSADDPTFLTGLVEPSAPTTVSPVRPPRPGRRRWFAAAGVAVMFLFAIIMILTDRGTVAIEAPEELLSDVKVDILREGVEYKSNWHLRPGSDNTLTVGSGKVRVTLPDEGNEYDVTPNELVVSRGKRVVFKLTRKDTKPIDEVALRITPDTDQPIDLNEPPALDKWLKGREVLTVAQDGSGRFRTIQSALAALQRGQVVNVLDKGPYRERILLDPFPEDCGLVTEQQTVIELPEWVYGWKIPSFNGQGEVDLYVGHIFERINGFRLHGFEMRFPSNEGKLCDCMRISAAASLVVENCVIRGSDTLYGNPINLHEWNQLNRPEMQVLIRECLFESTVNILGRRDLPILDPGRRSTVTIERNDFVGRGMDHHLMVDGHEFHVVTIRHNVFTGNPDSDIAINCPDKLQHLEVVNNTLGSINGLIIDDVIPDKEVIIKNNLRLREGFVVLLRGAEKQSRNAFQNWQMDHNVYSDGPKWASPEQIPPRPNDDLSITPRFRSLVPQDADYLRVFANDPAAQSGSGGKWPSYVGALPPGPVTKEGDWFSRLQRRWFENATPSDTR